MLPVAECVSDCSTWDSYWGLMTDVPHIMFEFTLEALTGILLYPIARRLFRAYRDRIHQEIDEEHGVVHQDPPRERPSEGA